MFTKILVPLDTSALADQALATAAAIAKRSDAELQLVLVHVPMPFDGLPDAPWNVAALSMERAYLDGRARELAQRFGIAVNVEHLTGPAAESIIAHANSYHTDLVVMTTHGRTGLSREWLGSVADTTMRSLDIPVLMLRPVEAAAAEAAPTVFRRIVIPLDGSHRAESIIATALAVGGPDATYVLVRVVVPVPVILNFPEPYGAMPILIDTDATSRVEADAKHYVQKIADRMAAKGLAIEQTVVVAEIVVPALLEIAKANNVDLIAIATHGRGVSRLVLGSVADKLLRGSGKPLLIARAAHT